MSKNNGTDVDTAEPEGPAPLINDRTIRYLTSMVEILAVPDEFDSILDTIKASTRGKESTEMHTRIRGLHYTIINAGVLSVLTRWESVLEAYLERTKERGKSPDFERWDWLIEANQAAILVEADAAALLLEAGGDA